MTFTVQIFKVEMGAEIRFRLKRGVKVSREAHLLVNKPRLSEEGEQVRSHLEDEDNEEQKVLVTHS